MMKKDADPATLFKQLSTIETRYKTVTRGRSKKKI
jgi:hypothetical protein